MIRCGITGYSGFLGTHFRLRARDHADLETILIPRSAFDAQSTLTALVAQCDMLIHLAATNRGTDEDVYATNIRLARSIVDACRAASVKPHIIFASSMYADPLREVPAERSNAFGPSKKAAEELFLAWGNESGARIAIFRLPNVFGEMAKPHHNSAVAMFSHQLVQGKSSVINAGAQAELVYVGEVVSRLYRAVREGETGIVRISGTSMDVADMYEFLKKCLEEYREGTMPACPSPLHTALFLTLHSHILRSYVGQSEIL